MAAGEIVEIYESPHPIPLHILTLRVLAEAKASPPTRSLRPLVFNTTSPGDTPHMNGGAAIFFVSFIIVVGWTLLQARERGIDRD